MERTFENFSMLPPKRRQPTEETAERTAQLSSHRTPLPAEIELQILKFAIPLKPYCVFHYFNKCFDQWSCPLDHHIPFERREYPRLPPRDLMRVSKTWRYEALHHFYTNHIFVFNTYPYPSDSGKLRPPPYDGEDFGWSQLRDPHATRLLNFIDRPDWQNRGSKLWRYNYGCLARDIDRYRYRIRKLALVYQPHRDRATTEPGSSDWDWVLEVNWKTLPDLEEVCLDLMGMNDLRQWGHDPIPIVEECVERMRCLSLKKLVLMNVSLGLLSHLAGDGKRRFGKLWRKAMGERGEIVVLMDDSKEW